MGSSSCLNGGEMRILKLWSKQRIEKRRDNSSQLRPGPLEARRFFTKITEPKLCVWVEMILDHASNHCIWPRWYSKQLRINGDWKRHQIDIPNQCLTFDQSNSTIQKSLQIICLLIPEQQVCIFPAGSFVESFPQQTLSHAMQRWNQTNLGEMFQLYPDVQTIASSDGASA